MLTREMMDAKLDEHFGYEARDDVEGVLATLTDDVEHDIVGWPLGPSHGPAEAARLDLPVRRVERRLAHHVRQHRAVAECQDRIRPSLQ